MKTNVKKNNFGEFQDKIDWVYISAYQKQAEGFIHKLQRRNFLNELITKIIENAINDCNYLHPYKVDKRRKSFKEAAKIGFSEANILDARRKRIIRRARNNKKGITFEEKKAFLAEVKKAMFDPYATSSRFNRTGIDWRALHRPSSNGQGWVLICPDEPGNNWYMEDLNILKILSKKYL
jgi:hypothetical protein